METLSAGRVWTSHGWLTNARIHIRDGIIQRITQNVTGKIDVPVLIPGMTDLHIHGFMGYNIMDPNPDKAKAWLRRLAAHGVTGVLSSPATAQIAKMREATALYAGLMEERTPGCAHVYGIHLEGPFINPEKKGGMDPKAIVSPSVENYEAIVGSYGFAIKQVTLAPEMPGASELIRYLVKRGVRVNAGHSNATAEEMRDAISIGVTGVTHFFNAARPIAHRDPGLLTEAMITPSVFCEMISDLVHLAPEIIRMLVQAVGPRRISIISDAGALTGMPDGIYGDIKMVDGSPRLMDGTLTGSRIMMDEMVYALIDEGIDPWDVVCMASWTPIQRIGLLARGDIAPLYAADLTAMTEDFKVLFTVLDGQIANT